MIGFLHQVRVDSNLSLGCVSKYKHTHLSNARGALLSLLILAFACLGSVKADAQNWTGSTVEAAKNKTVYLWNVGAKKFLGKGGRWGTEAIISNVGTPFKLVTVTAGSTYRLESVVKEQSDGSTSNGALGYMNGVNSEHDKGNYFVDRSSTDDKYGTRTFSFSGSQAGYQLKVTSTGGVSSDYNGTFYLSIDLSTNKAKGFTSDNTDYSKWIIVTEDERKDYFKKAEASDASAVPGTFLLFDDDFARNDNNVNKWQTKSSKTASDFNGTLTWNENKQCRPSDAYSNATTTTRYYTYTYTGKHSWTVGNFWNPTTSHDVTYKVTTTKAVPDQSLTVKCSETEPGTDTQTNHNASSSVTVTLQLDKTTYEDKEVTNTTAGYTYYNGNGYDDGSTSVDEDGKTYSDKGGIHWQELYGGDWTANIHGSYGVVNQTIPNENMIREGWYKVSCVGFTTATTGTAQLYASAGTESTVGKFYAVQSLIKLDASKQPTTYVKASKLINGGGYEASVMVYVGPKKDGDTSDNPELKTLSFGILVDGAESSAWTCFDNFQIDYLGMPNDPLVLDEEQAGVDYINKQTAPEGATLKKKTLYLHRTLNVNKWNSIVLPVSLTVSQVQSAFGDNTQLSVFKGATNKDIPTRMYFEAVNVNRDNKNDVAIEAGKLYIMKPTKKEPTDQAEISFPESTGIAIRTLTNYFTIPGVTFYDANTKFDKSVKGTEGDETFGSSQKVQFVGTYVAGDGIIPANSYVLRGNNDDEAGLWFYRTKPTTTNGFRGWLEVVNPSAAKQIDFSINGRIISGSTTSIEGIVDALNAAEGNIYNLNGQLVRANATSRDGLAKGVYIQNGKKFIVK